VVGTVPAIKPAASMSRNRTIGLLGTPGTVRRAYTDRLINQFAADCRVLRHGSAELVALAEAKLRRGRVSLSDVRAAVAPLWADPAAGDMDVVVLACTHFPLLAEELQAIFPPGVALVDSGEAIARRVAELLGDDDAPREAPRHVAVTTSQTSGPQDYLTGGGFTRIDLFDAESAATATVA
jgi:glutamate racemase